VINVLIGIGKVWHKIVLQSSRKENDTSYKS